MTSNSNPITDILAYNPFDYVEPCEPDCTPERHAYHQGQWDMAVRICKHYKVGTNPVDGNDIPTQALQALYEAVKGCVPEKMKLPSDSDTDKPYYYNQVVDEVLTNLSLLFGVPLGNLEKPEATNSQPQLADNSSEVNATTPRKPDDTDCNNGIHRTCYCAGRAECHDCGMQL